MAVDRRWRCVVFMLMLIAGAAAATSKTVEGTERLLQESKLKREQLRAKVEVLQQNKTRLIESIERLQRLNDDSSLDDTGNIVSRQLAILQKQLNYTGHRIKYTQQRRRDQVRLISLRCSPRRNVALYVHTLCCASGGEG